MDLAGGVSFHHMEERHPRPEPACKKSGGRQGRLGQE